MPKSPREKADLLIEAAAYIQTAWELIESAYPGVPGTSITHELREFNIRIAEQVEHLQRLEREGK